MSLFEKPLNETTRLVPGARVWIFRNDNAAKNLTIFQGVIDFETSAPVTVDAVCYGQFSA